MKYPRSAVISHHSLDNFLRLGILGICLGSLFGCGWDIVFWAVLVFAYIPFYVQTWEEYYLKVVWCHFLCFHLSSVM